MDDKTKSSAEKDPGDKKNRILFVVDGDASYLYYTGMLLQRLDYSVYTAKTAEETLEVMRFSTPLLILTELALPNMSGIEFLKKIKQEPKTKLLPVIIYTASPDTSLKYQCKEAGCTAYLKKPFGPDELYAAVQRATEEMPRSFARVRTCISAILGDEHEGTRLPATCITALSENGMYVTTAKQFPVGTQLPVVLFLEGMKITLQGIVLYSFESGKGPSGTAGMGVKFINMKPEFKTLITLFVKKELTHDLTPQTHGE
jgi:two-component system chemotaxis response regulator CheY